MCAGAPWVGSRWEGCDWVSFISLQLPPMQMEGKEGEPAGVGGNLPFHRAPPHQHTHRRLVQRQQRQLPLLGATSGLPLVESQTLNFHVPISRQVLDGLQVEAVGELEGVSIRQLDGQVGIIEGDAHLEDGEGQGVAGALNREPGLCGHSWPAGPRTQAPWERGWCSPA